MNKTTEKKIMEIEKSFNLIEKIIKLNKVLEADEKEKLIYSVRYVIDIMNKLGGKNV